MKQLKKAVFIGIFLSFSHLLAPAQEDLKHRWQVVESLTAGAIEKVLADKRPYPVSVQGTPYFYYCLWENGHLAHYLANAADGKKTELIRDRASFARQYTRLTGLAIHPDTLRIYGIRFLNGDMKKMYFRKAQKTLMFNIAKQKLSVLNNVTLPLNARKNRPDNVSCDSLFGMYGHKYDLVLRDFKENTATYITTGGKKDASYTYGYEGDGSKAYAKGFWISHYFVSIIEDVTGVGELSLINSLGNGRPRTKTFRMEMPGDEKVRQYKLFVYDADNAANGIVKIKKYKDQEIQLIKSPDTTSIYLTRRNRPADIIELCRVDLKDRKLQVVIREECKPHLNIQLFNCKIIGDGSHIIWWSERTGYGNYYLYDRNGHLIRRLTQGDKLVAGKICDIDAERGSMIFEAYGGEEKICPHYTLYYRVDLDGKKQELLTPGDGDHQLVFSSDHRYAADLYSRMDMPRKVDLIDVHGTKHFAEVAVTDTTELMRAGWRPPKLIKVKAADDHTDLYGVMYLPPDLDVNKKYPLITNVYPGPQDDQIPRQFTPDDSGNASLAALGFVVINVPPRGSSPLRGKDYYCFGYGNLRDYPLEDSRNTILRLAREYPFIDLDRVGIYGHSGGAFETVTSMLTYPDFYKVGVAASGNYDNNIYIRWWGEIFNGARVGADDKIEVPAIPTPFDLVANLKGRLMLITGDVDKNVHPASTYRLLHAFIKARKKVDCMIIPGADHSVESPYYFNLIRYYFLNHLAGTATQDIDIVNHTSQ